VRLANLRPEEVGGLVQARQIRLFGVASAARLSGFPKIPTLKEMGWDVQVEGMKGLAAPAGLPDAAATSLHDRFRGGCKPRPGGPSSSEPVPSRATSMVHPSRAR
jgi:tripartite-type tricarboxylate transporter receptor subunit TctC